MTVKYLFASDETEAIERAAEIHTHLGTPVNASFVRRSPSEPDDVYEVEFED